MITFTEHNNQSSKDISVILREPRIRKQDPQVLCDLCGGELFYMDQADLGLPKRRVKCNCGFVGYVWE